MKTKKELNDFYFEKLIEIGKELRNLTEEASEKGIDLGIVIAGSVKYNEDGNEFYKNIIAPLGKREVVGNIANLLSVNPLLNELKEKFKNLTTIIYNEKTL